MSDADTGTPSKSSWNGTAPGHGSLRFGAVRRLAAALIQGFSAIRRNGLCALAILLASGLLRHGAVEVNVSDLQQREDHLAFVDFIGKPRTFDYPGTGLVEGSPRRLATLTAQISWTVYTILVHNGGMKVANRAVRQSVSLPVGLAKQVGSMAKSRKLSKNRMMVELIENGIRADKRKQDDFFALAERFRNEQDPEAASRLGDELGQMVFGG